MKKNENNKTPSEIVLHHFDVHCTKTSVLSIAAAYILQLEYFTNHWGIHFDSKTNSIWYFDIKKVIFFEKTTKSKGNLNFTDKFDR